MFKSSESILEVAKAMVGFNTEFKGIDPDANNPFFKSKYISFDSIVGQRGLLAKYGLVAFQSAGTTDDGTMVNVTTRLVHKTGEWIESEPMRLRPVKADPQGMGSAMSYAKRYQLAAMLGIAEVHDDDANAATFNNTPGAPQQNVPQQAAPIADPNHLTPEQAAKISELIKSKQLTRERAIEICKNVTGKVATAELNQKEGDLLIAEYSRL